MIAALLALQLVSGMPQQLENCVQRGALVICESVPVQEAPPLTVMTPDEWRRINQLIVHSTPTIRERVDLGLMLSSVGAASIALGLTMSCTASNECRELNPVMRKLLGDGPVRAVTVKSVANAGTTYVVWRVYRGKTRTIFLAGLFAFNLWDAIHDVRQMRAIERRRVIAFVVPVF